VPGARKTLARSSGRGFWRCGYADHCNRHAKKHGRLPARLPSTTVLSRERWPLRRRHDSRHPMLRSPNPCNQDQRSQDQSIETVPTEALRRNPGTNLQALAGEKISFPLAAKARRVVELASALPHSRLWPVQLTNSATTPPRDCHGHLCRAAMRRQRAVCHCGQPGRTQFQTALVESTCNPIARLEFWTSTTPLTLEGQRKTNFLFHALDDERQGNVTFTSPAPT